MWGERKQVIENGLSQRKSRGEMEGSFTREKVKENTAVTKGSRQSGGVAR